MSDGDKAPEIHDEEDVNYKPPPEKSLKEIVEADQNDASLQKYKEALLGQALKEPIIVEDSSSNSSENIYSENFPTLTESSEPRTSKSVMRKDFITPKLVAALDRCQLSMRDSVFILEATIDALGCNIDEFLVSKSSIERIRTEKRKERVGNIRIDFQNEIPDVVTLHWDGKLLPAVSARKSKERLPIVISFGLKKITHCCAETG
ncbi:hypothetical protein AVEN_260139-1 [Araneus ventricosus]|uniref:Uncharacterized protein n=1 Tax=Araneus ventricosus TaxID=182803 RepID=A0A4Y2DJU4_ARAVE|nr:hypothetical protein AVEN_260139-1 [Araneus ventricosus]